LTGQLVQSPCTNVCRIEAGSGLCEGCLRTLDEIAEWRRASEARRIEILSALGRRQLSAGQAKLHR
jgi:predicted Fe-S protein YdhL (DUF1289 family)